MRRVASLFCIAVLFVSLCLVRGAGADRDLKYKDRGNRSEGLISVDRAKDDLSVLSFTAYVEPFETSSSINLHLAYYVADRSGVSVDVSDLDGKKQYRMSPKLPDSGASGWREFQPWPTGDVIVPAKVTWDNLGVLVRPNDPPGAIVHLFPSAIYYDKVPDKIGQYCLVIRSKYTLESLTVITLAARHPGTYQAFRREAVPIPPAAGVAFPIVLDLGKQPEGAIQVQLRGKNENRAGEPAITCEFYHQPQPFSRFSRKQ